MIHLTENETITLLSIAAVVGMVCGVSAVLGLAFRVFRFFAGIKK